MPISVTCATCGDQIEVAGTITGASLPCRSCRSPIPLPYTARPTQSVEGDDRRDDLPDEFHRDIYLLRQKMWSFREKYNVADEANRPIIFVERPLHAAKSFLAIVAGLVVSGVVVALVLFLVNALDKTLPKEAVGILAGVGIVGGLLVGLGVMIQLAPRRHVTFYSDESKTDMLMRAFQDQKWVFINQYYTLADHHGQLLCRFRKNYLHGIFRKRWYVETLDGDLLFVVKEDSVFLSVLRRTIGIILDEIPLLGIVLVAFLRTNFIFCRATDGTVIGKFNRRMTLLDRYVLDLTQDSHGEIDRRIAVAMGVLLDTGERR